MAMAFSLKATAQYDEFKDPFEGEMVLVEGGTFTMGCTDEQGKSCRTIEKPAHEVTVGSFYIARYEVTVAQWAYVMERTDATILSKWGDYPATGMTWKYANDFIDTLRYYTGKKYRLPTEAEWEFAARGGNLSKGYKYSGSDKVLEVAHCTAQKTERVGKYKPNVGMVQRLVRLVQRIPADQSTRTRKRRTSCFPWWWMGRRHAKFL